MTRLLLAAALLLGAAPCGAKPPNILFILADDVGSEALECYGGESYPTPALNQLAADGLRFTHAYAMPACHPTRTTLLSGQYPVRMGQPNWGSYPPEAEQHTIAHVLKQAGYATAIAGKWQLTMLGDDPSHPRRLGFDHYCLFGWHEGPRYYQPHIRQDGQLREDVADRYGPDVYCDFLIDFMQAERSEPFFAFYSMALCHDVTDDLDEPVPFGPNGRYQNYPEMVAAMDKRIGRLLAALDDSEHREDTLVLYFTDNGSPEQTIVRAEGKKLIRQPVVSVRNGQPVPGGKTQLTDAGTRVPLIARWPGRVPAGKVTDQLVDVSDFLPTLAEAAGGSLPRGTPLDGQSFAAVLHGSPRSARQWVYAERNDRAFVRDHRWKLYNDGKLFDMEQDPDERRSLDGNSLPADGQAAQRKLQRALDRIGA